MGANGSKSQGATETEEGRRWKTIETLGNGVKVIEFKNHNTPGKMPEESHSPNSIYAMMTKDGRGLKSIAVYDKDCLKVVEIHNMDHLGIGIHYHIWKNGTPVSVHSLAENDYWQNLFNETCKLL